MHEVVQDLVVAWLVAISAVPAHPGHVCADRVAPRNDGRVANPQELRVVNGGVAIVAGHDDGVAIETLKDARVDDRLLRPFDENGASAL